jgi:hypothetical protein
MSRGPGIVQKQLIEIFTKSKRPGFSTKQLCRKVFRIKQVRKKHRVSVLRALKGMSKKTTLNVWRAVLKGRRDDFWFNRDRTPKGRKPHPKSASALDRRPTK